MAPIARWPKSNRCSACMRIRMASGGRRWFEQKRRREEGSTSWSITSPASVAQSPCLESRRRTRVHTQLRAILAARLLQQVESRRVGTGDGEPRRSNNGADNRPVIRRQDEVLGGGARAPATRHESVSGSCRHRGCRPRGVVVLLPRCARAAGRSSRRRRVATRPCAVYFDRAVISRAPPGDGARFAHREVSREARARSASHHAERRRYPGRAD